VVVVDNGPLDTDPTVGNINFNGPVGGWSVSTAAGFGYGGPTAPTMDVSSRNYSVNAETLIVQLSDTNFVPYPNETFVAQLGAITDGTVTYNSYRDSGNVLFGTTSTYTGGPAGSSPSPTAALLMTEGPFISTTATASNAVVVPVGGTTPYSLTLETIVVHTSGGGSSDTDSLLFALPPTCNCTVAFNSPASITNCADDVIPDVTASEDCGNGPTPLRVTVAGAVTNGTCPQIITRTNTATDDCGTVHTFVQTITVNCKPDCTITPSVQSAFSGTAGYTASVADAGPGATYYWTIFNGTITAGQGTTNITWTAGTNTANQITICATVTTAAGCTNSCCIYLPLTCGCTINFTAPPSYSVCGAGGILDPRQVAQSLVATQTCNGVSSTVPVSFLGSVTNGSCPQYITNSFGATDYCGSFYLRTQVITVNCVPDCTITPSIQTAFSGTAGYTASVANAGAGATYAWSISNGSITAGQNTPQITWTAGTDTSNPVVIKVTVTTGAGCSSACSVRIPVTCSCTMNFSAPGNLSLCSADTIPNPVQIAQSLVATQTCNGVSSTVPVSFLGAVTNGTSPRYITNSYAATDHCGTVYVRTQTITINSQPDCTVTPSVTSATAGVSGYTASVANAGAGATYSWSITNGTITAGQGLTTITWTAGSNTNLPVTICVTVTTAAGCSSSCCATVPLTPGPSGCSFTPGGWGAVPNGNNVATLLYAMFPKLYPKGFVVGGTYTLKFTAPTNITIFLPSGGTPGVLKKSYINPLTGTEAGEFASQVMALKLNIDASNAGYIKPGLASLKVAAGFPLAGYKVSDVLTLCNKVLGGTTSALPAGVTVSDLTNLMSAINGNFDNCTENHGVLTF